MKFAQILFVSLIFLRLIFFFFNPPQLRDGQHLSFQTTLLSDAVKQGDKSKLQVFYQTFLGQLPIFVTTKSSNLNYGQTVTISGILTKKKVTNGSSLFFMKDADVILLPEQNFFFQKAGIFRQKSEQLFEKALPSDYAGLLSGVMFGAKGGISHTLLTALQNTGTNHIVVVAGMKLVMVSNLLLSLFTRLFKRQQALLATILGVLLYVGMVGAGAPVLRAALMMLCVLFAQLFGRQYLSFYSLVFCGGLLLLYNPAFALDVGFQLSFLSVLGITVLKPYFDKFKIVPSDISITICAQLATLPVLLSAFGTYGFFSVLANALILWAIPPLMVLAGVGALLALLLPLAGQFLVTASLPLLWFFERVIFFFDSFGFALTLPSFSVTMAIGYYMLLASLFLSVRRGELALAS